MLKSAAQLNLFYPCVTSTPSNRESACVNNNCIDNNLDNLSTQRETNNSRLKLRKLEPTISFSEVSCCLHTHGHTYTSYAPKATSVLCLSRPPRKAMHTQQSEQCWENNYANVLFPTERGKQWQSLYSASSFFCESNIKIIFTFVPMKRDVHACVCERVHTVHVDHQCVPGRLQRRCVYCLYVFLTVWLLREVKCDITWQAGSFWFILLALFLSLLLMTCICIL